MPLVNSRRRPSLCETMFTYRLSSRKDTRIAIFLRPAVRSATGRRHAAFPQTRSSQSDVRAGRPQCCEIGATWHITQRPSDPTSRSALRTRGEPRQKRAATCPPPRHVIYGPCAMPHLCGRRRLPGRSTRPSAATGASWALNS